MSRSDLPPVRLVASAEAGTDIFVLDSRFSTVAHAARQLDVNLPPGLYKVKFQAGSAVDEQPIELAPGAGTVTVTAPRLQFTSTAPLNGTELIHEYHRDNAARTSQAVDVHAGIGSRLFVFTRAWRAGDRTGRDVALPPGQNPAEGLYLYDLQGHLIASLSQAGDKDLTAPDPWAACSIELNPGPYRLRLSVPGSASLEQIVVASQGWQTQVFLLQDDYGEPTSPLYRPDLETASILMTASFQGGFDPNDEMLRLTELAHNALARRRVAVARDLLNDLLNAKFANPMLGLYAGHAILAGPDPDRDLLARVVTRLSEVIGTHPDLDAMRLWLGQPVGHTYDTPPMFRRSWDIVVERAAKDRSLIPAGSMASGIAGSVWGDSVWLIWDAEEAQLTASEPAASDDGVTRIQNMVPQLISSEGTLETQADLDDTELAILSYATRRSRPRSGARGRSAAPRAAARDVSASAVLRALRDLNSRIRGTPAPDAAVGPSETAAAVAPVSDPSADLAEALGLPPSTVQQKVGGLLRKLEAPPVVPAPEAAPGAVIVPAVPQPQARRYEVTRDF